MDESMEIAQSDSDSVINFDISITSNEGVSLAAPESTSPLPDCTEDLPDNTVSLDHAGSAGQSDSAEKISANDDGSDYNVGSDTHKTATDTERCDELPDSDTDNCHAEALDRKRAIDNEGLGTASGNNVLDTKMEDLDSDTDSSIAKAVADRQVVDIAATGGKKAVRGEGHDSETASYNAEALIERRSQGKTDARDNASGESDTESFDTEALVLCADCGRMVSRPCEISAEGYCITTADSICNIVTTTDANIHAADTRDQKASKTLTVDEPKDKTEMAILPVASSVQGGMKSGMKRNEDQTHGMSESNGDDKKANMDQKSEGSDCEGIGSQQSDSNKSLCLTDSRGITSVPANPMTSVLHDLLDIEDLSKKTDTHKNLDFPTKHVNVSKSVSKPVLSPNTSAQQTDCDNEPLTLELQADAKHPGVHYLVSPPAVTPDKPLKPSSGNLIPQVVCDINNAKSQVPSATSTKATEVKTSHEDTVLLSVTTKSQPSPTDALTPNTISDIHVPVGCSVSNLSMNDDHKLELGRTVMKSERTAANISTTVQTPAAVADQTSMMSNITIATPKHLRLPARDKPEVECRKPDKTPPEEKDKEIPVKGFTEKVTVPSSQPMPMYENISPVPERSHKLPETGDITSVASASTLTAHTKSHTAGVSLPASVPRQILPNPLQHQPCSLLYPHLAQHLNVQYAQPGNSSCVYSKLLPASSLYSYPGHASASYTQPKPGYAMYPNTQNPRHSVHIQRGLYPQAQPIYPMPPGISNLLGYRPFIHPIVKQTLKGRPPMARRMVSPDAASKKMLPSVMPNVYSLPSGTVMPHTNLALQDIAKRHPISSGPPNITIGRSPIQPNRIPPHTAHTGVIQSHGSFLSKTTPLVANRRDAHPNFVNDQQSSSSTITPDTGNTSDKDGFTTIVLTPLKDSTTGGTYVLSDNSGIGTLTPTPPKQPETTPQATKPVNTGSRYFIKGKASVVVPTGRIDNSQQRSAMMSPPPVPATSGSQKNLTITQDIYKQTSTGMKRPKPAKTAGKPMIIKVLAKSPTGNVKSRHILKTLEVTRAESSTDISDVVSKVCGSSSEESIKSSSSMQTCESAGSIASSSAEGVTPLKASETDGQISSSTTQACKMSPAATTASQTSLTAAEANNTISTAENEVIDNTDIYRSPDSDVYISPQKVKGPSTYRNSSYVYRLHDALSHDLTTSFSSLSCEDHSYASSLQGELQCSGSMHQYSSDH